MAFETGREPPMNDRRLIPSRFGPEGSARGAGVESGTLTRRSLLVAGVSAIVGGWAWGQTKRDRGGYQKTGTSGSVEPQAQTL